MAEPTQEASRSSKCSVEKLLAGLAFFCIAASAVGLVIVMIFLCPDCTSATDSSLAGTYWVVTILVLLFLLGVIAPALLYYYRRRQHCTTSPVAISLIPVEDLEKTPAPTLHYNRVSQRQQLAQASSKHPTSLDLPDYFSVFPVTDEVYSSVNAEVSSEDGPETPPPCYEEAIEITTLALLTGAANEVDTYSCVQYAFTQETMGKSNETFV